MKKNIRKIKTFTTRVTILIKILPKINFNIPVYQLISCKIKNYCSMSDPQKY